MFKKLRKNDKKGFTLIEILVVIALIGVLAAIAVPRFTGVQEGVKEKADIAASKLWMKEIEQMYILDKLENGATDTQIKDVTSEPTLQASTTATITAAISAAGVLTVIYDPDGTATVKPPVNVHTGTGLTLSKIK